jgi:predicted RNA-binding protein YlqC (UPF0109 family)
MLDPSDALALELLSMIICALVDYPEFVVIETEVTEDGARFIAQVHPPDVQRLIGIHGSNIKSIVTIMASTGWKQGRRYKLEIRSDPESCGS